MMLATYKRDRNLPPLLKHLTTDPPPSLRQIVIIWQNIGVDLPDFLQPEALAAFESTGVTVTVRKSQQNSMNERFRPIADWDQPVKTRAVMIMDDDIVLRREALEWGYHEFVAANREGSGRIVGFTGRDFEDKGNGEWAYTVRPKETYSMVLSNAAWLRREWLDKYWEDSTEMEALRNYVDKVFNCDDILINYLVSNLTGNAPLLLQPKTPLRVIGGDGMFARGSVDANSTDDAAGSGGGVPTASHFEQRKICLGDYFSHFASFALASDSPSAHYPLIKTRTSVSQDVEDHSRWLYNAEPWELITDWKLAEPGTYHVAPPPPTAQQDEGDEASDLDIDEMLDGMTEEEIDDLLLRLEAEHRHPSNGEEGLGEAEAQASLFEDEEDEEDSFSEYDWHEPIDHDEL
ncbi:hypothetical protein JCM10908_004658 [Rhodotorula pacifica]|uniref:uncharacterized protein n=1 Tax=Rhodotorula pacifica TaxID=1495444 RepID=UPI003172455D